MRGSEYRTLVAVAIVVGSIPGLARATVGGPSEIEVLGFEPGDRKVYFLRHDGSEEGRLPELHYFRLDAADPARAVRVESWYRGADMFDDEKFEKRLERLRARLEPLERIPQADVTYAASMHRDGRLHATNDDVSCRRYALHVEIGAAGGTVSLDLAAYCRRENGLRGVWRVPGERWAVAMVRYVGVPFEDCYERDEAALFELP